MSDAHLLASYAGDAAQVEDTLGLPSYAQYKKYATFRIELTDFGVDLKQLTRLLAECDYGLAAGGMGLGDLHILFNTMAKRTRALNYEGVLRLCRLLRPRLEKLEAMMSASDPDQQDPTLYRPQSTMAGGGNGQWATAQSVPLPAAASLRLRGLHRPEGPSPVDFAAGMAAGEGGAVAAGAAGGQPPNVPAGSTAVGPQQHPAGPTAGLKGVSFRQGTSGTLRPASASRLAVVGSGDVGLLSTTVGGGWGASTSGRVTAPSGLSSLMALKEPPVLLREQLPPPPCKIPAIAQRISGIMVLYRDGEMTRVGLALRDLQRDWEDAAQAAAITAEIRRQAHAASQGGAAAVAAAATAVAADPSKTDPRGGISLEGRIWLLLLHGCALMMEAKYRAARKSLQAAQSLFDPHVLGMEHPYHCCTYMLFGLLSYYELQYEDAIDQFECARELADLVSRGSFNVLARRNAAACLNNKGVCHSLLGNRSEAVIAFRDAYQMFQPMNGVPEAPESLVAQRNLNKALKQGFALNTARLRPTSAPAMYSTVGNTTIPHDQKLPSFLRSAIMMRTPAPVTVSPAWCIKVTADDIIARNKLKEAEKKAKAKAAEKAKSGGDKGKAKVRKPTAFNAMDTYPYASYGLANIKLPTKRGRKKKVAAS